MKTLLLIFSLLLLAVDLRGQPVLRGLLTTNAANASQFGAGAIKSGALLTNINVTGYLFVNTNVLAVTNGSVGVGTTNPLSLLHVAKNSSFNNNATDGLMLSSATTPTKRIQAGYDTTIDAGYFQAIHFGNSFKPIVFNASGGNVGIATTNPTVTLDVIGTNRASYFIGNGAGLTNLVALTNGNASIWLPLPSAKMPNTNFMITDWATNYTPSLITTTNTSAFFTLPIPSNYVSNTLAIRCQYAMESGITNSFILGASVMAMNPDGSTDQTVDSFGSEITVTNTVPGAVGAQNAFTLSLVGNTDGLQSGDLLHLKLRSSTTITNRVFIKGLQLRYTQQ